jgi:chemotaxis protein histidine kinase CheA
MSATMGFDALHHLSHELEELCQALRTGALGVDEQLTDLLREGMDRMGGMVDAAERGAEPDPAPDLEQAVRSYLRQEGTTGFMVVEAAPEPAPEPDQPPPEDTSLAAIAELMAVSQRLRGLRPGAPDVIAEARRIEAAARTVFAALARARQVGFETVVPPLRRHLRRVCAREGKEAQLEVSGGATLVDPSVLGALQGALVQLLNNAVVHGLEAPQARRASGRPGIGLVQLTVDREGESLRVTVTDDGSGFQVEELLAAGRSHGGGNGPEDEERTETARVSGRGPSPPAPPRAAMREAILAALTDGVTTRGQAGPDAGRGEGLGAVRQAVEALGGRLEITSKAGRGSSILVVVPVQQRFEELLLVFEGDHARAFPQRIVLGSPDGPLIRFKGGHTVRVGRVLGLVEALVSPAPFPFNLLPQVTGTTVGPDGTILFVLDPTPGARP